MYICMYVCTYVGLWLSAILLLVGCALVMVSVVIWLVVAFYVGLQQSKNDALCMAPSRIHILFSLSVSCNVC